MRILLAGASGLIGSAITDRAGGAHELRRLVRRAAHSPAEYSWNPVSGALPAEAIAWADAVISLSGASLSRLPWTPAYRRAIRRSRVQATETIAQAIRHSDSPPAAWVSASAVGFYGDRPGESLTEAAPRGDGFLAGVTEDWEDATAPARAGTRVVHARTGLVLAADGALRPLILATRLGLGARVGDGTQHWPWIGLADEARAMLHLATASALEGPVNLVGPTAATARDVTGALADALHRPHRLVLPTFALRAGLGRAADDLLLADQEVESTLLQDDGFTFETPTVTDALERLALTRR